MILSSRSCRFDKVNGMEFCYTDKNRTSDLLTSANEVEFWSWQRATGMLARLEAQQQTKKHHWKEKSSSPDVTLNLISAWSYLMNITTY